MLMQFDFSSPWLLCTQCLQVRQSDALVELLKLSLHVANFMNAGSARQARAIQLKTLEKFATVKGIGAAATAKPGAAAAAAPLVTSDPTASDADSSASAIRSSSSNVRRSTSGSSASVFDRFTFGSSAASKSNSSNNKSNPNEVTCPAYTSKSLMHFVAYVSLNLAPSCLALSSELSTLERAAAIDISGLDGSLKDLASGLRLAQKEVGLWCKDADAARAAAAESSTSEAAAAGSSVGDSGAGGQTSPEYALKMGVPEGVLELRAALARAEQTQVAVSDSRRGASQLASDAMTWLGEKSATATGGGAESASSVHEFLTTALGVSRAFSAAVADNAVAAEAEARRQKKLAAEAEKIRLKEEARAHVLEAEAAARAALEPVQDDEDEGDEAVTGDGGGGGLRAGVRESFSARSKAPETPNNRWKSAAAAVGQGKMKRGLSSRSSLLPTSIRGGVRSGRKDAFAGGGGLFSALSSMRSNMTGKGSGHKEDSDSSEDGGDDMWKSSESEED